MPLQPAAFYKGILLPLAAQRPSIREAAIVSSAVAKVSPLWLSVNDFNLFMHIYMICMHMYRSLCLRFTPPLPY
jgi:hypothetical protein